MFRSLILCVAILSANLGDAEFWQLDSTNCVSSYRMELKKLSSKADFVIEDGLVFTTEEDVCHMRFPPELFRELSKKVYPAVFMVTPLRQEHRSFGIIHFRVEGWNFVIKREDQVFDLHFQVSCRATPYILHPNRKSDCIFEYLFTPIAMNGSKFVYNAVRRVQNSHPSSRVLNGLGRRSGGDTGLFQRLFSRDSCFSSFHQGSTNQIKTESSYNQTEKRKGRDENLSFMVIMLQTFAVGVGWIIFSFLGLPFGTTPFGLNKRPRHHIAFWGSDLVAMSLLVWPIMSVMSLK